VDARAAPAARAAGAAGDGHPDEGYLFGWSVATWLPQIGGSELFSNEVAAAGQNCRSPTGRM